MDDFNESYLNTGECYIPYNSQLLILKTSIEKGSNYFIKEFYHPSITSISSFKRHFGIWMEKTGLEIFEPDIYQRRLDMNRTNLLGYVRLLIQIKI